MLYSIPHNIEGEKIDKNTIAAKNQIRWPQIEAEQFKRYQKAMRHWF